MARLILSVLLLVLAPRAFAVSLGDELILSRLGDPIEVEIEVLQWEDMDLERVQISAATREEYEVFNLTWLPVLEELNFNVVGPDLDGDVRVLISSRDPLNEPFLELLLVLRWPGGSLRREYVLLFDPPGMELTGAAPVPTQEPAREPVVMTVPDLPPTVESAPVEVAQDEVVALVAEPAAQGTPVNAEPESVVEPPQQVVQQPGVVEVPEPAVSEAPEPAMPAAPESTPAEIAATADEIEPATTTADASPVSEPEIPDARTQVAIEVETLAPPSAPAPLDTTRRTYQVRSGDSLWNIARQFRPAGAGDNLYQMLLGIHNLNRASFINGNISLLKANALLQMPTVADIDAIDASTAQEEFDRRWNAGTERFDAVQRGEAIPLFAPPPEEPLVEVEEELPPGVEAPPAQEAENELILASDNVPALPLAGSDEQTQGDDQIADAPVTTPELIPDAEEAAPQAAIASGDAVVSEPTPQPFTGTVSRASLTAELETEVAAMRTRRESAEALAQRLQDSLQQAQARRTAQASMLSPENLLLAGGALALLVALVAGVVANLKIAAELRQQRNNRAHAVPVRGAQPGWLTQAAAQPSMSLRKEPRMPEMEVVELEPAAGGQSPAERQGKDGPDDLFARMDDILASATNSPKK